MELWVLHFTICTYSLYWAIISSSATRGVPEGTILPLLLDIITTQHLAHLTSTIALYYPYPDPLGYPAPANKRAPLSIDPTSHRP